MLSILSINLNVDPASGTSIDYWQHRGVPYIYGVELRPEEVNNELQGFHIPPDQIEPTGKKIRDYWYLKKVLRLGPIPWKTHLAGT
jgi:hypothetical protein